MLAIPVDNLLQRMDEIEKECLNGVSRWRALRAQLEAEAVEQNVQMDKCPFCGTPRARLSYFCHVCGTQY